MQCWALPYCAGTNPNSFVPSTLGNTFKIMNTAKTAPKSTNFILKIFNNADSFKNWTTSYFSRRGWVLEIFEDETSYALLHGITDKLSNSYVKLMWTNFFKLFVPLICTYLGHQGRFLADKAAIVAATSPARCCCRHMCYFTNSLPPMAVFPPLAAALHMMKFGTACILFCCQISKLRIREGNMC